MVPWKKLMLSVMDALFAFVLGALLSGQTRAQVPAGRQEDARAEVVRKRKMEYPDLVKVVDLAQSAPAEFAADALLRVAASERNHDREWKIELLEGSFQMAALARQPNRQKIICRSRELQSARCRCRRCRNAGALHRSYHDSVLQCRELEPSFSRKPVKNRK